ncbi:hypothetical protein V6N13_102471 [Hibiscus sabdariffa]|uniref:Uncharacterized protein n=1 Tax=Hibiscus sabdariffa TaxID=183260 RepID=A0ABR2D449_9ROSI
MKRRGRFPVYSDKNDTLGGMDQTLFPATTTTISTNHVMDTIWISYTFTRTGRETCRALKRCLLLFHDAAYHGECTFRPHCNQSSDCHHFVEKLHQSSVDPWTVSLSQLGHPHALAPYRELAFSHQ